MQTNEMRGLLYEFGIVLPEGHRALLQELPAALAKAEARLPALLIDRLRE
jgi:transposase